MNIHQPIGEVANATGQTFSTVFKQAWQAATIEASAAFLARMASIATWANITPFEAGSDVPGWITSAAPLPLAEMQPVPEVDTEAALTVTVPAIIGANRNLSLQDGSVLSIAGLALMARGFGDYVADGIEDAICDGLTALSLPTAQDITVGDLGIQAMLNAGATLANAAGNRVPVLDRLLCSEALRCNEDVERAARSGIAVQFSRFLPYGVAYLLPDPANAAILAPVYAGAAGPIWTLNEKFSAAATLRLGAHVGAGAPQYRSAAMVRGVGF